MEMKNEKDLGHDFYTVEDVAKKMRMTPGAIHSAYNHGQSGKSIPPSIKLGRRRMFKVTDYNEWYDSL